METIHTRELIVKKRATYKKSQIGFVPTMGALHDGHIALIKRALTENECVFVSIFINPTQFNRKEDLLAYPDNLIADLEKLSKFDRLIVFTPSNTGVYPDGYKQKKYNLSNIDTILEGAFRPGHFQGVAEVVDQFFKIINPARAYFGEKDFQQLQVIRTMAKNEGHDVKVIACPTIREEDGLAMSSRNMRLTKAQRAEAPIIYRSLIEISDALKKGGEWSALQQKFTQNIEKNGILKVEYLILAEETKLETVLKIEPNHSYRLFTSVFAGDVRLIDNVEV